MSTLIRTDDENVSNTIDIQKKNEIKDFSINENNLYFEFSEKELNKIFPLPKNTINKVDPIPQDFVDAAIAFSQKTFTENSAVTYNTSNDPRIDFFFNVLEDTSCEEAIFILKESWEFNCLDTLRLLAYLRDIRNGKSIKYVYFACLYWLYQNHPRTLSQNLNILIKCGCYKDLLILLVTIMFNGTPPKYILDEETNSFNTRLKSYVTNFKNIKNIPKDNSNSENELKSIQKYGKKKSRKTEKKNKKAKKSQKEIFKRSFYQNVYSGFNVFLKNKYKDILDEKYRPLFQEKGKEIREREVYEYNKKDLVELSIKFAREKFNNDDKYRYFHLKIAEFFAKQLIEDKKNLESNEFGKISLAAKWAPTLNGHFDKLTLISSSIALQIVKLTKDQNKDLEEILNKPIVIANYLARKNYHKNYLVKLRSHLKIPETYMCKNQWDLLPYKMVPSKCMQKNKGLFLKHDNDRFSSFIESNKKVAGATLKPHELVNRAFTLEQSISNDNLEIEKEILDKQWISLKESIKTSNSESAFKNALAVCDTSGSMSGTPLLAAIGLSLMTMSFCKEPWCNILLSFSENPTVSVINKNWSIFEKVNHIKKLDFGYSTDFSKTFKLILELANTNKIKPNEMPKYLFVFTDMEFNEADDKSKTNFEEAKILFKENNYELPVVVFWNLRSSRSVPVQKHESGSILLSGYSANQVSLLLETNIESITPYCFLEKVLNMKKYEDLVVID